MKVVDEALFSDISDEVKKILNTPFKIVEVFRNRPCDKDELCGGTLNVTTTHLTDMFFEVNELGYGVLDEDIDENTVFEVMSNTIYFDVLTVIAYIIDSPNNIYTPKENIYDNYNYYKKNIKKMYLNEKYDTYLCIDMLCTLALYHSYEYIVERKYI